MSLAFLIYSFVIMLVCIVATAITNSHLPRLDRDLVSAGEELVKFRKMHAEWLKIGIPMLIVWVGLLIWDFFFRQGGLLSEVPCPCADLAVDDRRAVIGGRDPHIYDLNVVPEGFSQRRHPCQALSHIDSLGHRYRDGS